MAETNLKSAILKTLVFFDIFEFPLTPLEIKRYLYGSADGNLETIEAALAELTQVKTHQGFYFLASASAEIVARRQERYLAAEKKYRKVKRIGHFLALLPFVRLIAVCNSLAYSNARPESDIDLFVVSARGKVWTTRFVCLLFLKIFGLRPTDKTRQDKFCLSFFVDESHLDLSDIALARNDIYFYYWLAQLYPVYDAGGVYGRLWQANGWLKDYLPLATPIEPHPRRLIELGAAGRMIKKTKEAGWNFAWCEELLRKFQLRHLPAVLKEKLKNKDVGAVIGEGVVKLIANDRREGYRNEWVMKVNRLLGEGK
ncbi:MAG: hypothetical protein WCT37_00195 [Patescibacteria group bacterium]|jgi:hypothetical protein